MQRYLGKKNFPFIKLSSRIISDYQGKLLASIEAYEEIVAYARKKQAETGSKLLWGTANVFGHARYMNGAATNPDFDVVARAAVQIKNALDATIALGGENYVFWGGREGYMSLLNTDQKREKNHLALLLAKARAIAYSRRSSSESLQEILLIANYYDAYTIEREGQFTDKIVGEYLQVNLYTAPRFTSVASEAEALKILSERHIDLIILMAGLDKQTPLVISRHLKDLYPNICQLMLVNNNSDLAYFHTIEDRLYESIERLFVWNGSTKIFLVMAKYIEDKMNLDRDTHLGDIRVILLVENSIRYYSRYLPLLYTEVMTQTQELIFSEPQDNDMSIVMKIRVRPKVILATNYEEAVYVIDHYRENLIGVISDVRYKRNGEEDEEAGIELIRYVKRTGAYIPCMLQSQEIENTVKAEELHAAFINKNSPTLAHDIQDFIKGYLGFGDFIFRNKNGEPIDRATSIEEFKQKLLSIPDESLIYHSIRNGISTWLMAHREITLAKHLKRYRFEDFPTPAEMRQFILRVFEAAELKKIKGRIINYNPKLVDSNRYITRLGKGSFGGKGRGMAFLSNFIENVDFKKLIPKLKIEIPKTAIIGVANRTSVRPRVYASLG